jgi:2-phosphosulfolactate phosphatase
VSDSTTPFGQAKYQVRLDWGVAGAERILPGAHVVVLVDALLFTTTVVVAAEQGVATAPVDSGEAGAIVAALAEREVVVLAASLRNRTAVAERILALQEERGERLFVAIVAAGERTRAASDAGHDGELRFAIEDQLVAGAVVDALVGVGIDHTSPEAAVASAAFEGLRHAATHLIGASGSAVELADAGFRADVRLATQRDVTGVVPGLRDGVFRA